MSKFLLIAGPCVIESEENVMLIAEKVKTIAEKLDLDYYFKASFDNPIHMIFGHGFMVSQNQTVAITASLFNGHNGVRTAHNGYLQVLYEFGIVQWLLAYGNRFWLFSVF